MNHHFPQFPWEGTALLCIRKSAYMPGKEEAMKTIRVTGKGQIKVHPDMTRIMITLKGRCREYSAALRRSAKDTESLRELLGGLGFEHSDLKTLRFDVDMKYEYADERRYKRVFDGYEYEHEMKVEFASDNKLLGKVLYALANSPVSPELQIGYFVKDPEAAKDTMLANAVADAREKAAVLSRSAGVTLKDIQAIDYSWGEVRFESRLMECASGKGLGSPPPTGCYDMDIEPDDIESSDNVTVVWEIA